MHISLFVRVNAQLQFFMRRLLFQLTESENGKNISPGYLNFSLERLSYKPYQKQTAPWCNGSTSDSGSFCRGSNPCGAAIFPVINTRLGSHRAKYKNTFSVFIAFAVTKKSS